MAKTHTIIDATHDGDAHVHLHAEILVLAGRDAESLDRLSNAVSALIEQSRDGDLLMVAGVTRDEDQWLLEKPECVRSIPNLPLTLTRLAATLLGEAPADV